MSQFRALGMDSSLVRGLRKSLVDPFGSTAEVWVAKDGRFPCRHCLDEARPGSRVLLFSYQPLERDTPYAGRGPPVFVCAEECASYGRNREVPEIVASRQVNLRAYDSSGKMLYSHSTLTPGAKAGAKVAAMLKDEEIAEVHAHTALHGCFLCKFERA